MLLPFLNSVVSSSSFAVDPSGPPRSPSPGSETLSLPLRMPSLPFLACGPGRNAVMWREATRRSRVLGGDRELPFLLRTCLFPWRFLGRAPGPLPFEAVRCRRSGWSHPWEASLAPPTSPAVTSTEQHHAAPAGSSCSASPQRVSLRLSLLLVPSFLLNGWVLFRNPV